MVAELLRLLLLALLGRRLDLRLKVRDSLRVLLDAGRELRDLRRELVHRGLQLLLLRRLVLLHHRGLVDLLVAPVLVVVLVLLLRHEVEDHLLDHVLDLVERARARGLLERRDLVRQLRQSLGLLRAAGLAEEVDDRLARVLMLRELHEADALALRSASASDLLEHLDGLAHGRSLTRPALHALVVLVRARVALLLRLVQLLLGRRERLRRALEIRLRRRKVLALLALDLGLAVLRAGSRVDLVLLRRIRELVRARRRRLRLVQLHQVILELELQVLQRLDDVPALEVVSALTALAVLELVRGLLRRARLEERNRRALALLRGEDVHVGHRLLNLRLRLLRLHQRRLRALEGRDRIADRLDRRLEVALVRAVQGVGLAALGLHGRLRGLVLRNVRLKLLDLGGEGRNVLGQSLDGRLRNLDLLLGLLD